jgi:hypothetical protein
MRVKGLEQPAERKGLGLVAREPLEGMAGTIARIGWVVAPAAIVAVTYTVGAWKDDRVREARQRAQAERPRPAEKDGPSP